MASVNDIIGSYRLVEELDCGTFGCIYRGEHIIFSDDPVVAIKMLHVHLGAQKERDRFIQEARLLKKLNHPHILPILGAGIHEGSLYLIVEYAPNGSLAGRLKPGKPLPTEEAVSILSQIGEASNTPTNRTSVIEISNRQTSSSMPGVMCCLPILALLL